MLSSIILISLLFIFMISQAAGIEVFFYFAYGSNLLSNRILIMNPTAVFYGTAKLSGYRLSFNMQVPMWNGAVATIVEDSKNYVFGDLWLIDVDQMKNLDKQEGVDRGWYYAKNVTVARKDGFKITARTYIEVHNPKELKPGEKLPNDRRPSNTYLKVIIVGAIQSNLPADYINYLKKIPTNNKNATKETLKSLGSVVLISKKVYDFNE